ncbi:SsgA family sporulation/cell division regulator [Streptomyces sp. NPDC027717]|uniref:SsgA family sporulation/cell division regulator n=1 Tax=Streptomyces sp. NPDC027717 TaxID=3155765 RepID=UPI0033CF868C
MSVVEQYTRAHIVTDAEDDPDSVRVVLRYDPEADPSSVQVGLPGATEWTFSRALLEDGLRAPAESGDVRVWPCGRVQAVLEFHSPQHVDVVQFDVKSLTRFLLSTYTAEPVRN